MAKRLRDLALFDIAWIAMAGLEPSAYGSHSLRRTKVSMLYRNTGKLRACQLLLGHTKLESNVRYLESALGGKPTLCCSRPPRREGIAGGRARRASITDRWPIGAPPSARPGRRCRSTRGGH